MGFQGVVTQFCAVRAAYSCDTVDSGAASAFVSRVYISRNKAGCAIVGIKHGCFQARRPELVKEPGGFSAGADVLVSHPTPRSRP